MTTDFLIPPSPRPAVPVDGGGLFPVRRILCVARNYAAHAREMGQDPDREPPFFFTKPADDVFPVAFGEEGTWPYPRATCRVDHELEMVVALGSGGADLDPVAAEACVWGYAIGLDMTRRDLQAAAKSAGRPWDMAKGFDACAPISPIVPRSRMGLLAAGTIELQVNGATRQRGDLSDMIWPVGAMLAELSRYVTLQPGDLVFTGTPEGVGPVERGDRLIGHIAGLGELRLRVV
ncbi:MAG: fumarylacetoacetate hydrolase family protein [Rhodocyclaceae bacterium]|jgi:fumarylpyruvate hydrolase|nr:fumarylacetoacetate hydrolase family protein [Rhodocyclaceae bacterium]